MANISKKKLIFIILGAAILLTAALGAYKWLDSLPRDLGPKLQYIGKSDYGCWFICDSPPASVYYFATEMSQEELTSYFRKSQFDVDSKLGGLSSANYNADGLNFGVHENNDYFAVDYYDNTQAVLQENKLKNTGKPYVISIPDSHYLLARDAL